MLKEFSYRGLYGLGVLLASAVVGALVTLDTVVIALMAVASLLCFTGGFVLDVRTRPRIALQPEIAGACALLRVSKSGRGELEGCYARLYAAEREVGASKEAGQSEFVKDFEPAFSGEDMYFRWRGLPDQEQRYNTFRSEALVEIVCPNLMFDQAHGLLGRIPDMQFNFSTVGQRSQIGFTGADYTLVFEVGAKNAPPVQLRCRLRISASEGIQFAAVSLPRAALHSASVQGRLWHWLERLLPRAKPES